MNALQQYQLNAQPKTPDITKQDAIDKVALKEKTDQFEALFVKMLLDESLKNEKSLFGTNDPGERIYKSLYRDELSQKSAGSFGFSKLLFDFLVERKGG